MFKRILVPTDGSKASVAAAEVIASLTEGQDDVFVTLLCCINLIDPETTDWEASIVETKNLQMQASADLALAETARPFAERSIPHTVRVVQGDPTSSVIAEEACAGHYDLVAMGSRGMGMSRSDRHYLGSVTDHVIRRVKAPVLVIPVHKDPLAK